MSKIYPTTLHFYVIWILFFCEFVFSGVLFAVYYPIGVVVILIFLSVVGIFLPTAYCLGYLVVPGACACCCCPDKVANIVAKACGVRAKCLSVEVEVWFVADRPFAEYIWEW